MAKRPKIFRKKEKEFLKNYLATPAPTGYETEGQKVWLNYVKNYCDDYITDHYGSVAGVLNPGKKFKVVIEAHSDEIGWYVNYIKSDGLMNVIRLGGSDHQVAPAQRVNVHTKNGIVKGVFGWPAIHTRTGATEKNPKVESIYLDVGATNKEEVLEMGIHVGTPITYEAELITLNDKFYVGRALDNRMGGFMIAQVLRLLKEQNIELDYSLYVVNAVQEEIGLRGAQMIANTIQPNCAIITDVTHDTTTPMISKATQGEQKCGDGPVLTHAPSVHKKFLNHIIDIAEKQDIKFQHSASGRSTGTDTDAFAYTGGGIPSALISLPLRYMHTPVESASINDIENTIYLMYEALVALKSNFEFNYFK